MFCSRYCHRKIFMWLRVMTPPRWCKLLCWSPYSTIYRWLPLLPISIALGGYFGARLMEDRFDSMGPTELRAHQSGIAGAH